MSETKCTPFADCKAQRLADVLLTHKDCTVLKELKHRRKILRALSLVVGVAPQG